VVIVPLVLIFVVLPLFLAAIHAIRGRGGQRFLHSNLYVGQVWHTRLQPKRHAFHYPIFMFALDLEEDFNQFNVLWPMVQFRASDHLKNGEGLLENNSSSHNKNDTDTDTDTDPTLAQRVLRLVSTKTNNKCQPTLETHRILLLTHLSYYGYNFNPVSFYYIVNKQNNELTAIVGEVSNTPWTEMHCYVLHPDSVDQVVQQQTLVVVGPKKQYEYRFPKQFHVSPFMEMEYWYDWSFVGVPGKESSSSSSSSSSSLTVINSLRRRSKDNEYLAFTAKLQVSPQTITPFNVAYQMIRFPVFCLILQLWIHYQAFWLFVKGIAYVPHPNGSETAASQAIAALMTPFFALRDYVRPKSKTA
jgi:DUF1365 family protein